MITYVEVLVRAADCQMYPGDVKLDDELIRLSIREDGVYLEPVTGDTQQSQAALPPLPEWPEG